MENNNGKGIFYGVIGVATLVVAIIGATFAYFTATATNDTVIAGNAATTGLNLEVTKISTQASGGLIPMSDEDLQKGVTGEGNSCVDANGNTVCQVYSIHVTNTGNSTAVLTGTLSLSASTYQNLKWAELTDATTVDGENPKNASTVTSLVPSVSLDGSADATYYIVIWISETGADQSSIDTGSFTGTVTFNTAGGDGVTATFS